VLEEISWGGTLIIPTTRRQKWRDHALSPGGVAGIAVFSKHRFPLSPHRDARCVDPDRKCHRGGDGCPTGGVRCLQTMLLVFLMANTMRSPQVSSGSWWA